MQQLVLAQGRANLFQYATTFDYCLIGVAVVLNFGSGIIVPISMVMMGAMIDAFAGVAPSSLNYYVFWHLMLGVMSFFVCLVGAALMELTAERQTKTMKSLFLSSIMRQEMKWFDAHDPGKLSATLNENILVIRDAMGVKFAQLVYFAGIVAGGYIVALIKGWKMALVLTVSLPLMGISGWYMMRTISRHSDQTSGDYGKAGALVEEAISAIRSIVAFGLESHIVQRYNAILGRVQVAGSRAAFKIGLAMGCSFAAQYLTYSLGFWWGSELIVTDGYTAGKVLAVFTNVLFVAFSIGQSGPSMSAFARALGAAKAVETVVTKESEIDPLDATGFVPEKPLEGHIEFKDVAFHYPTRPDKKVFGKLNLVIDKGESVALVGASGCGKSTIVQLIERFYDLDAGQILIDGRDIKEYNLRALRQEIALVSQEPKLFATTIAENIAIGKEGASMKDVEQAAVSANAHTFVTGFPDQYDTFVGESGSQLSGGQKQRIAIARAILRNPSILILDEATSALDNESEKIVQETLDNIVKEKARTTIIIAHRLSTVRKADRIVVLDNAGNGAEVVEQGTHDELMEVPNGLYAALVASQTMPETKDEDEDVVHQLADVVETFKHDLPSRQVSLVKLRSKFSMVSIGWRSQVMEASPKVENWPTDKIKSRFPDIMRLMKPYFGWLSLGLVAAGVNGILFPVMALVLAEILESNYSADPDLIRSESRKWALVYVGLAVAAFAANFCQQGAFGWSGQKVVQRLRAVTFEQLIHQDIPFFDDPMHSTGKLSEMLSADPVACRGWAGDNIGIYFQNIVCLVGAIVFSFISSPKLAAVCVAGFIALIPAMALEAKMMGGQTESIGKGAEASKMAETSGYIFNEVIMNLRTVAAYTMQDLMLEKYERVVTKGYQRGVKRAWALGLAWALSQFLQYGVEALGYWYSGQISDEIGMKQMIRAIFALMMASMGIGQSAIFLTDNTKAKVAAHRLYSVIERRPIIDARNPEGKLLQGVQKGIVFKHLKFRYPARPDVPIYRDLNFDVKQGEVVALVGASGCGKSTVVQLLERFYDAQGLIKIDDTHIQDLNIKSLRSRIGLVNQEPVLFDATIEENIAMGKVGTDATPEEVEEAARKANAYDFIKAFPEGFQTNVGRQGGQLSGGQKQRIAIARALIRDPSILILDEATSALDAESEKVVQETLDNLLETQKRTAIIIAHRLSTVQNADKIVVMVNSDRTGSRVAEVGTHDQLMQLSHGVYRGLVQIAAGH